MCMTIVVKESVTKWNYALYHITIRNYYKHLITCTSGWSSAFYGDVLFIEQYRRRNAGHRCYDGALYYWGILNKYISKFSIDGGWLNQDPRLCEIPIITHVYIMDYPL